MVAYLGKRGENALTGFSSLTERLQTERDRLERQVAERDMKLAELNALHAHDRKAGGTPAAPRRR